MKVCMFAPTASGGHARYTWELATALARRGAGVEVVSCEGLEPAFRSQEYPVHPVLPAIVDRSRIGAGWAWVGNRLVYYPRRERQFLRWLRKRPDISAVHFQEWKPWLAPAVVRRIRGMGKRVFYTVHNVRPHRYPPGVPKWLMDRWIRRSCLACDGLFVHTRGLAEELAGFLGRRRPAIHVIPHGVWTTNSGRTQPPPLDLRLSAKRLLFFGAIRANKGLDLLLRAMHLLPDYHLTLAGDPSEPDHYASVVLPAIQSLRSRNRSVTVLDRFIPDPEVAPLFASHGAAVLPYTAQFLAQSGVVFTAIAHDTPVVASRAGGLAELLGEFPVGTTFDTHSPEALAAAIRELHDRSHRADLRRHLDAARRHFTWDTAAAATLAGYAPAGRRRTESTGPMADATADQPNAQPDDRTLAPSPAH
jgi:glycosyltransferase involved in cell wall biosynthesis